MRSGCGFDLAGRRTGVGGSYARTGVPQAASAATYNVNNQLTNWKGATLTYDANGNSGFRSPVDSTGVQTPDLTSDGSFSFWIFLLEGTDTWNARNQLVSISGGAAASFQYDPFGRRVSKTIGGTTQYLYDGANPVQEISGTTASANLLTGGVDEYFERTDSAGGRSFLTDALGSTLALADSTGTLQTQYTFEPFGNTTVSGATTTTSFAFTGRELDPTGLYFYRARYYNPLLQRFITEDPSCFRGGVNLYAYAADSAVNLRDPFGLQGTATTSSPTTTIGVNPSEPAPGEVERVIQQLEQAGNEALVGIGNILGAIGLILFSPTDLNSGEDAIIAQRPAQPTPGPGPEPSPLPGRNSHNKERVHCTLSGEFKDPSVDPRFKLCSYSCSDLKARVLTAPIGVPCLPTFDLPE